MFDPAPLPPPLVELIDGVRALADDDRFRCAGPAERASWLVGLRQLVDATEAVFTHTLATFDAHSDGHTLNAASSTQAWLRGALKLAPADAGQRVHLARGSRNLLAQPVQALAAGAISYDQLRAIETNVRTLPEPVQADAVTVLTDLAQHADVTAVQIAGHRLRHIIDPDGVLHQNDKQFTRRHLTLSTLLDGMSHLHGLLDAEATTVLATALAPFLVPAGPHDHRSTAQRRADGLIEVATTAMTTGQLPQLSATPTQLQVLVPIATLTNTGTNPDTSSGTAPATGTKPTAGIEPGWLPEHPNGAHYLTPPCNDSPATPPSAPSSWDPTTCPCN